MNREKVDLLIAGRDGIAVDEVRFSLVGINPLGIGTMAEATNRGLGEDDLSQIKVTAIEQLQAERSDSWRLST